MEESYEELVRKHEQFRAAKDAKYKDVSKDRLLKISKKKIQTTMIGALSTIEKQFGFLSRMDVLQAGILNYRIKNLQNIINKRRKNANFYLKNLDREKYFLIDEKKYQFNTYHTFVIQVKNREKLINFLKRNNIGTAIHYPIPIHLQPASKYLGYKKNDFPETEKQSKRILTLPIHQNLKISELKRIVKKLNQF